MYSDCPHHPLHGKHDHLCIAGSIISFVSPCSVFVFHQVYPYHRTILTLLSFYQFSTSHFCQYFGPRNIISGLVTFVICRTPFLVQTNTILVLNLLYAHTTWPTTHCAMVLNYASHLYDSSSGANQLVSSAAYLVPALKFSILYPFLRFDCSWWFDEVVNIHVCDCILSCTFCEKGINLLAETPMFTTLWLYVCQTSPIDLHDVCCFVLRLSCVSYHLRSDEMLRQWRN